MIHRKKAESNFKELFGIDKINAHFPFKQYIAKNPIIDNRVILNGNRFFFLEPLEATAVNTYQAWCQYIWDAIIDKTCTLDHSTKRIKDYITKVQNFILWHYETGSIYKTPFWKYATKLSKDNRGKDLDLIIKNIKNKKQPYLRSITNNDIEYAQWETWNINLWKEGVTKKNDKK